jgi:hypothetical protein
LVDVFIYFFDQEAKLGYYSKMQSNKLKSAESNRKNIIAKFTRVQKIVKLMLMNIGSYPGKKPTDPKLLDKCLVSNEVTRDIEKWNKLMNGIANEVTSMGMHESAGIDERSQKYQ